MNRRHVLLGVAAAAAGAAGFAATSGAGPATLPALPAQPERWLNSAPLGPEAIAARPVLIEVWTFGCYNCRNTLPWVRRVHRTYAPRGLVLVSVHTPEFAEERDPANVRAALARLEVAYPVLLDPDMSYWRALDNRYWPAFYLYDRSHALSDTRVGELHDGDPSAVAFERRIGALLGA